MTKKIIIVLVVLALAVGGGYWFMHRHSASGMAADTGASVKSDSKVLYYYDPMVPAQHFDKPGKSPFMDMQLVPRYADEASGNGSIAIDPRVVQNLGVRTAKVERGSLAQRVETVGTVQADEHRIVVVQSRTNGWVERLLVRAVNDPVSRGQLLAEVYSPDLLAAQQEFLLALGTARQHPEDNSLVQASRDRLSFLGLSAGQIAALEKSGQASRRVALYSPVNGNVAELGVREGMAVSPGMTLFNLVDLSKVWVTAEITEARSALVKEGQPVEISISALPGRTFKGRVDYVYPEVMAETRTLKARIALDNPRLELKPGMYATVTLAEEAKRDALLIPSEAVIRTGTRSVVIVADDAGHFRPVPVTTGTDSQDKTEILEGLTEGQEVVTSGQFLIDSEANLRGALDRLAPTPVPPPQAGEGEGGKQ